MSEDPKVTIDGKAYLVGPLRCKHLRQISKLLKDKSQQNTTDFTSVERWMPFVLDAIKSKNPEFKEETLDEMTLQEFNDTWNLIVGISGVQLTAKGEAKPALNGEKSTVESPLAVAGTIVQ